jgi:hypothetical protein
MFELIRK